MKLRTRPKYYYRSLAVFYIIIFLWMFYLAINRLANGLFLVALMAVLSAYWIWKAWKEYNNL